MRKLDLPPLNHSWVETADGTRTLFSVNFQEACHSPTGAREETLLHYIKGCQIESKPNLSVLEVGFGLGIGFMTTYDFLQNSKTPWSFLSLEIDANLLEWFRLENLEHPFLKNLTWTEVNGHKVLTAKNGNVELTILSGDARAVLPDFLSTAPPKWNAIYQDAFSPKKNPTLWSVEWFTLLKSHASPEVVLSTYSSSDSIRRALIEAGWRLYKGQGFGAKKTSTRATLTGDTDPEILLLLSRSPVPAVWDELTT